MSLGSNTVSYPAFAHVGLRENPGKNLNQEMRFLRYTADTQDHKRNEEVKLKPVLHYIDNLVGGGDDDDDDDDDDAAQATECLPADLELRSEWVRFPLGLFTWLGFFEVFSNCKPNIRVQGLVIVLARGRRHVKKLSVRETSVSGLGEKSELCERWLRPLKPYLVNLQRIES
ncbi:hypothetical protein ANN_08965 [Periplaneta americana]|uniref:Uncharacterized protein n=1 Tax=Periplaneta americana TaxID=6978 RepID=A0ABQ8T2N2_PERAM|nr:hypothetical protein ANN_08965 [Periplaneta americana]